MNAEKDIPSLKIHLLGPPVVFFNGQPVKVNRRENRALLYYLAAHVEPLSRAHLCDTFFPKVTEIEGRKKLREAVSRLRSSLSSEVIIAREDYLSLDSDLVSVDTREFSEVVTPLLNSSEFNSLGKMPDWLYNKLRAAVRLCNSNQFLQGFVLPGSLEYEQWMIVSNQSYFFSRQKIFERLADHCISIGSIDEAIVWLGEVVKADPLNTDNNFLILNCLRDRGRTKEAYDYISYLEGIYQSSQGEPLPEVLSDFRRKIEESVKNSRKSFDEEWPGAEKNAVPFVGRTDLLNRLKFALHRKGIVFITGESGSGKNRLVQEFYSQLEIKPRLVFCVGKPMLTTSPFSSLIEGLRTYVKREEWLSLPQHILEELSPLFPELVSGTENGGENGLNNLADNSSQVIYNALYTLLCKMAEKKPLLLVIDIVFWCDDATIEFLTYLNERKFFKKYGLLILIGRTEDTNPLLDIYIDRSVLDNNLEKMIIPPFALDETSQLVTMLIGSNISLDLLNRIQADTGGNPFFLIETIRAIGDLNFNPVDFSTEDLYPIPDTIQAIVHEKIRQLSKNAVEVLYAASVLGRQFWPETLELMIEMETQDYLAALDELQRASIILGERESISRAPYEFPHDQIREIVLKELSPARKRNLHLTAVKAINARTGNLLENASIIACHFDEAGEPALAFEAWRNAGLFARSRFSKDDTYSAYRQALELIPSLPSDFSENKLQQFFIEWADYAYDLADHQTCEMIYRTCLEIGESKQSPLLLGTGFSGMGRVYGMRAELDEGIENIERALFFLSKANSPGEEIEAYTRIGILHHLKREYKKAQEFFERGLESGKDYSDKRALDAVVNLQTQLALIDNMLGWPAKAEQIAIEAVNNSQLVVRRSAKVRAVAMLAMCQHYTSKYKKSIQTALSVYELANKLNMRFWISILDIVLAKNYLSLGYFGKSLTYAIQAYDRELNYPFEKLDLHSCSVLGGIYHTLGDLKKAEEYYRLGSRQPLLDYHGLENYYRLGLVLCQKGQKQEGLAILDHAIAVSEKFETDTVTLFAKVKKLNFIGQQMGDEEFDLQMSQLESEFIKRGFGVSDLLNQTIWADVFAKKGEKERAIQLFEQVLSFSKESQSRWYELRACMGLGKLYSVTDPKSKQIKENIKKILDEMAENSGNKLIRDQFNRFRKELSS